MSIQSFDVHELNELNQINGYYTVGFHPWYINPITPEDKFSLLENSLMNPLCLALGECGLDKNKGPEMKVQKEVFINQIGLAQKFNIPLIIHCVKAFDILFQLFRITPYFPVSIIHGFERNEALAIQLQKNGFFISLGVRAILSGKMDHLIKMSDSSCFFIESDDSDLPIQNAYEKVSKLKNESILKLLENQKKLYKKVFPKILL